jgi:hypothetical protein
MKRKIYFILLIVTCVSIATPVFAAGPMFGDTHELVGDPVPNDHGSCTQEYTVSSPFLWISYNTKTYYAEDVSCLQ